MASDNKAGLCNSSKMDCMNNKKEIDQRNEQIDIAKGLLMTITIFGHVLLASTDLVPLASFFLKFIYSFHMPAFLIISGILFDANKQKKRKTSEYIINKVKNIMIPYFLFEVFGGIVHYVFTYGERETIPTVVKNIITFHSYVGANWYLLTYLFCSILFFLKNKIRENKQFEDVILAFIIFIGISISQYVGFIRLNTFILRILLAFFLILIGNILKSEILSFNWKHVFIAVIGLLISVSFNSNVFLHAMMIGNPVLFLLGGICGSYLVIQVTNIIKGNIFKILGRYSIVPMGIHQNIIWIIGWLFGLNGSLMNVTVNFILAYISVIAVTITYVKLKKCITSQN